MKKRTRKPGSTMGKIILGHVAKLDKDESTTRLAESIMSETKRFTISERNRLLRDIKMLLTKSQVKVKGRLSLRTASRILAAITFWEYSTDAYALNLLFDDGSRSDAWNKLSKIAGMKRHDILSIVESWNGVV